MASCSSFCAVPKGILQTGYGDPNIQTVSQSPVSPPEQEMRSVEDLLKQLLPFAQLASVQAGAEIGFSTKNLKPEIQVFIYFMEGEKKINQNSLCMSVTFLIQALTHFASPGFNAFLHDGTICLHWSLCTQPVQHLFSASSRFENGKHV